MDASGTEAKSEESASTMVDGCEYEEASSSATDAVGVDVVVDADGAAVALVAPLPLPRHSVEQVMGATRAKLESCEANAAPADVGMERAPTDICMDVALSEMRLAVVVVGARSRFSWYPARAPRSASATAADASDATCAAMAGIRAANSASLRALLSSNSARRLLLWSAHSVR